MDSNEDDSDRQAKWYKIVKDALERGAAVVMGAFLDDKLDPNCKVVTVGNLNTLPKALAIRKVSFNDC